MTMTVKKLVVDEDITGITIFGRHLQISSYCTHIICMCMHVCMARIHVCMCVYAHVCGMHVYIQCMHILMHGAYACYICMLHIIIMYVQYVCTHVCMYVCIYVCICIVLCNAYCVYLEEIVSVGISQVPTYLRAHIPAIEGNTRKLQTSTVQQQTRNSRESIPLQTHACKPVISATTGRKHRSSLVILRFHVFPQQNCQTT